MIYWMFRDPYWIPIGSLLWPYCGAILAPLGQIEMGTGVEMGDWHGIGSPDCLSIQTGQPEQHSGKYPNWVGCTPTHPPQK